MTRMRVALLTGLAVSVGGVVLAEDITISTYYPSPRGVYQELRTTNNTYLATQAGNVGIGTTVPISKLHVSGGTVVVDQAQYFGMKWISGNLTRRLIGTTENGVTDTFFIDMGEPTSIYNNAIRFWTTDNAVNPDMVIKAGGKVGIGTTSPAETLHILGTDIGVAGAGALRIEAGGYPAIRFFNSRAGGRNWQMAVNQAVNGNLDFKVSNAQGGDPQTAGTNVFSITSAGNVGIGTTGPDSPLEVIGNIHATGTITADSDVRFKADIKSLTGILPKLDQLHGITYTRSELAKSLGRVSDARQELGIIGQELEKVFPQLVLRNGPEQYRSVDYSRLSVVLLEALKEQQVEVKELRKAQTQANQQIQELKEELKKIKR